jgi:C-22 sterol desaturase
MAEINGSFVSPPADATLYPSLFQPAGIVADFLNGLTVWKALITLLALAIAYDQCKDRPFTSGFVFSCN